MALCAPFHLDVFEFLDGLDECSRALTRLPPRACRPPTTATYSIDATLMLKLLIVTRFASASQPGIRRTPAIGGPDGIKAGCVSRPPDISHPDSGEDASYVAVHCDVLAVGGDAMGKSDVSTVIMGLVGRAVFVGVCFFAAVVAELPPTCDR